MNKQKQAVAVYLAITSVFAEHGVHFEDGMDAKSMLTTEQRNQVRSIIEAGFESGTIEYKGEVPTGSDLKSYVSGLVSNWLRKDKRLNGGSKYQPKNPGSRAGSGDEQVKALRALLSNTTDAAARAEIQGYLDARLAEIKPAKSVTINIDALPAELRAKYAS